MSLVLGFSAASASAGDPACVPRTLKQAIAEARGELLTRRASVRQTDGSYLNLDVLGEGKFAVATSSVQPHTLESNPTFQSPMLLEKRSELPARAAMIRDTADGKTVVTDEFKVLIQKSDLGVELKDAAGNRIARIRITHAKEAWKTIEIEADATHIYGLGEYPRSGNTDRGWLGSAAHTLGEHGNIMSPFFGGVQTSTQFPIAYGVRENGTTFAIFVDTPYKIDWDFKQPGKWKASTWGDELRYYVLTGKDLAEVHGKYLSLVGKSPVPPRSVFGVGTSKFGYRNWADVDHDLAEMRQHGLPVGMVSLDLFWFGGDFIKNPENIAQSGGRQFTRMGSLTPDEVNFPNFQKKIGELKRQGTEVMLISESYVNSNLPEAQKLIEWGCVVKDERGDPVLFENKWWGSGYMIDWTHPNSKEWVKLKYVPLAKMGIRNFWFDLGEPEAGLYAPNGRYHGVEPGKVNHGDIHNIYNLMWVKAFKEVMDVAMPNDRFYLMNRSGTSGLNRFGAGKWGGDTGVSVLKDGQNPAYRAGDIPELIAHLQNRIKNMPLVGIDYYTSDVGGFHRGALGGNRESRDLSYTVWYANSALLDMPFRPHLWIKDGETNYLPTNTGHVPSNVANSRLRAELEPYYYQAAYRAHTDGTPIVAPLFYYHPHDLAVREMGHEAYIGPDLLMGVVGNVYEKSRDVYLPEGGWYDFHSNQFRPTIGKKGRWIKDVIVKQGEQLTLPLFAREGSIVPLDRVTTDGIRISGQKGLRVRIFGGQKPTESRLLEDDGVSRDYENGQVQKTLIRQRKTARGYEVVVFPARGNFKGARTTRSQRIEMVIPVGQVSQVEINDLKVKWVTSLEMLTGDRPLAYRDDSRNVVIAYVPSSRPVKTVYSFKLLP